MSTEAMKQALAALKGFQQGCTYPSFQQASEGAIKAFEEALEDAPTPDTMSPSSVRVT